MGIDDRSFSHGVGIQFHRIFCKSLSLDFAIVKVNSILQILQKHFSRFVKCFTIGNYDRSYFLNGPTPASFHLFLVFSKQKSICTTNQWEKCLSNEYKAPGFEPTTSQMELSPITPRPRLPPNRDVTVGEVSLYYRWATVWLLWYDSRFCCQVESESVKLETSQQLAVGTVTVPLPK